MTLGSLEVIQDDMIVALLSAYNDGTQSVSVQKIVFVGIGDFREL